MSSDPQEDALEGLMRKVLNGIAEMEVVREAAEEFARTPYEPFTTEPEPEPQRQITLSELEEDDVYQFKKLDDWR